MSCKFYYILKFSTALLLLLGLFGGCATSVNTTSTTFNCEAYYETPVELQSTQALDKYLEAVRPVFIGKKIFIDPGHGGEDRRSKGVNKLVVEADINLYTAMFLKDFLTRAGAEVIMSRITDKTVKLEDRSSMANISCADIFISVHHNAPGSNKETWINYTSTYYHALETDYEYEPMEHEMARYIQRDLSYSMRNSGGLGSFDGTYSDYTIYPKSGFSVLRRTSIPAVLVECSFFTNPMEEKKLASSEFNRIEAFGIFRGLARYLRNSYPVISVVNSQCDNSNVKFTFAVTDSISILPASIKIFVDEKPFGDFKFDTKTQQLEIKVPYDFNSRKKIKIIAANSKKNSSPPFEFSFQFSNPN